MKTWRLSKMTALFGIISLFMLSPFGMTKTELATSPEAVRPLTVGAKLPDAQLWDLDGKEVSLESIAANKRSILVFYRGGWCPYCNTHLGKLKSIEEEVLEDDEEKCIKMINPGISKQVK